MVAVSTRIGVQSVLRGIWRGAMPEDSYDILRRALLDALGPRPSAERRRKVAADLRTLAEQQERMADRDMLPAAPRGGDKLSQTNQARSKASARIAGYYVRI